MLLRRLEHSLRNLFNYFFRTLLERIRELESRFASAEQRRTVGNHLAKVMAEGQRLHRLGPEGMNAATPWAADTYDLISDLFGAAAGEIFSSDAGFPVAITPLKAMFGCSIVLRDFMTFFPERIGYSV